MGLIKALVDSVTGALADQWLEILEADGMSDHTVFAKAVAVRKNGNKKGTEGVISNGSVIHVYPGQFMMLLDGGKVVDYTAEPGYYKVDSSSAPSLFAGQFGKSLKDAFVRVAYGGSPSYKQQVYFINLQEIKGLRFGTRTPVNYFDTFYGAELFLRAHGNYSVKITNPILFYTEAIPKNKDRVEMEEISEQYLSEFMEALQASINQMSVDGIRISHVASKATDLSKYMANCLDESWNAGRGFEVCSVGIASVSYDDESKELINMRNKGAMLSDATVREGYVQGSIARGIEAAGSNTAGSAQAFMGMGVGMGTAGGFMGAASETNRQQMATNAEKAKNAPDPNAWICSCGANNTGKFCSECGSAKQTKEEWTCPHCGSKNTGKFCSECGNKKPENVGEWFCTECGHKNAAESKFCPECGHKK